MNIGVTLVEKKIDRPWTDFVLGAAIGTVVSLIIGLLFAPESGQANRAYLQTQSQTLKDRITDDKDIFSTRIRSATDEWLAKLRSTAGDMVSKGYLTSDEANAQINRLLEKVRG